MRPIECPPSLVAPTKQVPKEVRCGRPFATKYAFLRSGYEPVRYDRAILRPTTTQTVHVQVMTTDMTPNAPLDEAAEAIARQAADRAAEAARAAAYEEALATIAAENEAKRAEEQRLIVEAQKAAAREIVISRQTEEKVLVSRLMSQNELADLLGVSPRTLEKWRLLGRGPQPLRDVIGGKVFYSAEIYNAWVAKMVAEQLDMNPADLVA